MKDALESMFETFRHLSKEEWLEKIRADLKDRAPEDIQWVIEPGIVADPFPHQDDLQEDNFLPESDDGYRWEITEAFDCSDGQEANMKMLRGLEGGTETVLLHNFPPGTIPDFETLFHNIRLDFIHTLLAIRKERLEETCETFSRWLQTHYDKPESLNVDLCLHDVSAIVKAVGGELPFPFKRIILTIPQSHDQTRFVETTAQWLVDLTSALENEEINAAVDRIGFEYRIGNLFFVEIARLLALRILWRNFSKALTGKALEPFILARFRDDIYGKTPEDNMIKAATMMLSAVLGGANAIQVRSAGDSKTEERDARIARNVHHILRHESNLESYKNAGRGSYYVESLVKSYAEACWEKVREKLAGQTGESDVIQRYE